MRNPNVTFSPKFRKKSKSIKSKSKNIQRLGKDKRRKNKLRKLSKDIKRKPKKSDEKSTRTACSANFGKYALIHLTRNENIRRQVRRIASWFKLMDERSREADTLVGNDTAKLEYAINNGHQCPPVANATLDILLNCPAQIRLDCNTSDLDLTSDQMKNCSNRESTGDLDNHYASGGDLKVKKEILLLCSKVLFIHLF